MYDNKEVEPYLGLSIISVIEELLRTRANLEAREARYLSLKERYKKNKAALSETIEESEAIKKEEGAYKHKIETLEELLAEQAQEVRLKDKELSNLSGVIKGLISEITEGKKRESLLAARCDELEASNNSLIHNIDNLQDYINDLEKY